MVTCLRNVTRVVTGFAVGFYVSSTTCSILIGRSHGELGCITVYDPVCHNCDPGHTTLSSDKMSSGEKHDVKAPLKSV